LPYLNKIDYPFYYKFEVTRLKAANDNEELFLTVTQRVPSLVEYLYL
jgi:hypothetical protein